MIDGIKLQLSTQELKELIVKRVEYHQKKHDWAAQKVKEIEPELGELDDEAGRQGKYTNSLGNGNPVSAFKQQAKHHGDRVTYFKFLAEHLIPNETYVLEEDDLRRIEVLSQHY